MLCAQCIPACQHTMQSPSSGWRRQEDATWQNISPSKCCHLPPTYQLRYHWNRKTPPLSQSWAQTQNIKSGLNNFLLQSTMHHIPILNSHCKYKLWLLNKETSLKNYFNIAIIVPTRYSFHSNFHHQLHTVPYESPDTKAAPEVIW
jgi:hypothetical protein